MCIILQLPQATMLSYSFCMIAAAVALLTPCHAQNCAGAPELPSIPGVSGLLGLGGKNSNALHVHVVIITLQEENNYVFSSFRQHKTIVGEFKFLVISNSSKSKVWFSALMFWPVVSADSELSFFGKTPHHEG